VKRPVFFGRRDDRSPAAAGACLRQGDLRKVPVELGKIQSKSLTIKGTIGSPGVWPAALRFLARTKLDLSPIQTHFFDLTDGVEAFEFGKNPSSCIKITLTNAK